MDAIRLLLLDLDNTLIDRDAAFRAAVTDLLAEHGLPPDDLGWIEAVDRSGYAPRTDVVQAVVERYDSTIPYERLLDFVRWGAASHVRPDPVVVTNGAVAQQTAKLRNAGLDNEVAGWVVSEAVGHRKPEREIFDAAAESVGTGTAGLDGA